MKGGNGSTRIRFAFHYRKVDYGLYEQQDETSETTSSFLNQASVLDFSFCMTLVQ